MKPSNCPASDDECPLHIANNGWAEYKAFVLSGISENKAATQRVEEKIGQLLMTTIGIGAAIVASLLTMVLK